ncbi:paraquat-inducible protein A [Rhodobacteraceae bacterium 2CG4]|uniref:Paraquat-inducible protein A n=1 Tax=Halovulum marinum TaxID=2662447 RepID=A0A6L5YXL3_9RHOB|nr:paraquat-inducible protein A [Halovulum marinum]MSU88414.1 paraquat-inducible protein A [Halovulum marinum]
MTAIAEVPIETLIACHQCDALHRAAEPPTGGKARCRRCGTVLIAPRRGALVRVLAMAITVAVLMLGATFFPFLGITAAGVTNESSVFDAALAFSAGPMVGLSIAVAALIVFVPLLRMLLLIYVLGPLAAGRAAAPQAAWAFRTAEALRPWSMAEIFLIGVAVALVKVAGLATVVLGPAFWMFVALVIVAVLKDGYMCRWSIWQALERSAR